MAITLADFNKIWASTSPLTPYSFSESNYKQGWNFIGSTPPARQMWDYLQKYNDEKMQYLANNYLPLSGGTMTGNVTWNMGDARLKRADENGQIQIYGGVGWNTSASLILYGNKDGTSGDFNLSAHDGTNRKILVGKANGTLTWDGKEVERVNARGSDYIRYESGLQICWGQKGSITTTNTTVTFPVAFNSQPRIGITATAPTVSTSNTNETGFSAKTSSDSATMAYIAIGYWK